MLSSSPTTKGEEVMFSIGLGIFILGIVVFLISSKSKAAKRLREAQAEYKAALTALQQGNTSANRVRALELGRHYVSLCREGGKATMFDEVALQNDLKAYSGD
jgi:hypothetical protein